jgi:hypothetical protein
MNWNGPDISKISCSLLNVLFILLTGTGVLHAQHTTSLFDDNNELQQILENNAEQAQQEDADYSSLADDLLYYAAHPINLNHTTKEELQALHLLTDIQIANLFTHIEKNGSLLIIYELQAIEDFDLQTIQYLLPYITVRDELTTTALSKKKIVDDGQQTLILRYGQVLEQQRGFMPMDSSTVYKNPNAHYIGSPQKLYARYRYVYGTAISLGITAEKDQGELFFKNKQAFKYDWYNQSLKGNQKSGFDFYSAHLFLHNLKHIQTLAIGDYQVTFGQGLTAWSGMSFGKSSEILYTKKSASYIRPYTSVDENKFMRGVATGICLNKITCTAFYSHKAIDANVTDTLENGDPAVVSSLQQTGSHTTPSEIADKHAIHQTQYGGNISYNSKRATIGITAIHDHLEALLRPAASSYNQFEKGSTKNTNIGMDYNFILRNFNFFGEAARSSTGGMAFLNGLFISLDQRLSFTILQRSYQRTYQNSMSAAFAESNGTNEKGLYMGIAATLNPAFTFNAYFDRFEFPWLKYLVDVPSRGNDFNTQLNCTPSKKWNANFRIRQRNKEKNSTENGAMNSIVPLKYTNYRFSISYIVSPAFKFRNRVDIVNYRLDAAKQNGYLLYQDILYNKPGKAFSATIRYALFQTDGYDSRLYEYENDIPGSYSIPNYSDRGSRFYLLLNYRINRYLECWLRFAQTVYDNKNVISEGTLAEIDGNTKSEVKIQLSLKW